jgi:integrase
MTNKYNILFLLKKTAGKDTAPIRCRISWCGINLVIAAGWTVKVTDWETSSQRLRARSLQGKLKTPAYIINRELDEMHRTLVDIFRDFDRQAITPTAEQFRSEYDRRTSPQEDETLFSVYDKWVASEERPLESLKKLRSIRNHLHNINPAMTFADLETTGMTDIIAYLGSRQNRQNTAGLSNNTINKMIAQIKTFVRWAQEMGYCDVNRFTMQRTRLKTPHKTVIFLDWDELMKVYNFDFGTKHYLSQVRDVFCFCCFTGLRYSDVYNLKHANIYDNALHIVTIKTNSALTIELNDYSRAILAKYADHRSEDDAALPVISNQKMNAYLKELGQLCEITAPVTVTYYRGMERVDETYQKWELLSTHAGRRTFVCNALMLGIAPDIVMKWTGHSNYKAMKPYIDISDKAKRQAMDLFNGNKKTE